MQQVRSEAWPAVWAEGRGLQVEQQWIVCTPLKILPGRWDAPWDVLSESKQDMVREQQTFSAPHRCQQRVSVPGEDLPLIP